MTKNILIITGPTASGKTDLSERIADHSECEIINADVGQFYKPLSVGTAKPNLKQTKYQYKLFDLIDSPEDISVIKYRQLVVDLIQESNSQPIIVGGSLFYIKSLFFPPVAITKAFSGDTTPSSNAAADWDLLQRVDPERASKIHPNDNYRVARALQIWRATGQKPSLYRPKFDPVGNASIVFVCPPLEVLNQRIKQRTEQMIKTGGWIEEAKSLLGTEWESFVVKKGLIGYSEIFAWLQAGGKQNSLNDLVEAIQIKTIQYAKRQKTFWRSFKNELSNVDTEQRSFDIKIVEIEAADASVIPCLAGNPANVFPPGSPPSRR